MNFETLTNILKQTWWEPLGVISAITISIWVYFKQKSFKRLSYNLRYADTVINDESLLGNNLSIRYNNQDVEELDLLVIQFVNNGNVPIKKADFEEPIRIRLVDGGKIIKANVKNVFPSNLEIQLVKHESFIEVNSVLINPKEFFDIIMLIDGSYSTFQISARIEGISEIKQIAPKGKIYTFKFLLVIMLISFVLAYIFKDFILFPEFLNEYFEYILLLMVIPLLALERNSGSLNDLE